MADDITIGGTGGAQTPGQDGNQGDQIVAQGTQPSGQQPASDQLNPVIDLRGADQKPAAGSAAMAAGQAANPANPQNAQPPAQTAQKSRRASTAIMLGEEEEGTPAAPQEKYAIPSLVKEKFPDLIQLIKETESMNDEERDYWFQILPIMTEEQIRKFRDILVNEKHQLSSLDQEYEQELQKLNEKHMIEWKEFETREKRKTLTTAEQASKQQEQTQEEDLLKRLSQI